MGIALVLIEKEMGGERWVNTHAVQVGGTETILNDEEMSLVGAGTVLDATTTANAQADKNFLQTLLNFERNVHHPAVAFKSLYLSDGKSNIVIGQDQPRSFWTTSLDFTAIDPMGGADVNTVAPGGITLMLSRNPAGFSQRKGRMFLRAALMDTEIRVGGPKMIDWTALNFQQQATARITSAIAVSGLQQYFGANAIPDEVGYGIPHYKKDQTPATLNGDLGSVTPCVGFSVIGPVLRQVKRGRKEKVD